MSSIPEGGRMALSPSLPSESSTALSESSTNENNNQFTSITVEFIYSGESSSSSSSTKNGARKRITKAPAAVQKLLIRPTAASLPNRLCEKCHDLHEVVMIEQEEDHEAIIVNSSITILQTNTIKPACQLKTIGDYAFAECIKLPRISIAWSVETIGKNSFARCNQLVQVDLNAAVSKLKHIGFCSFYQCTALARIYIPSTVEEIEGHAFHGCRSLKEVKLLAAFEQPKDEELRLGSLVVGPSAFLDCSSFEKIKIPSSLEKLPKSCFHSCSNLKQVSLPEGLKKIKASSFLNCISLNYVKIPSTVETIEQDSFKGCSALEGVDFGSPHHHQQQQQQQSSLLKHMEWEAFMDCIALRKVKIPNTLTVIKSSVFFGCTSLVDVELSEGVQEIQHSAFGNCLALQAVILPQSVELVGIRAFARCPRLVTVEIPPTGMSPQFRIRKDAFVHCKAMINVSLPRSLSEEYKIHGLDNSFGSGFGENGFQGCTWLEQQYGRDLAPFFMGEISRFGDDYPIHKLCYHSSATSVETLRKAIQNHQVAKKDDRNVIVDDFGMSPFHILLTAGKRRVDLLEVLLETYPSYILGWEDVTGKKAIEYCFLGWNWTIESMYMVQLCLQNYVTRRLSMWGGSTVWDTDLTAEINSILSEDNNERQQLLWRATFATFQVFEQVEGVSVLELALWKREIFEQNNGDLAQDAAEREVHRARCGSSFVIPNVVSFLELG